MGMLGPFPNRKSHLSVRNGVLLYKQLIRPLMDCVPREEVRCPLPCPGVTGATIQVSSPRYWCPLGRNRQIYEDLGVPLLGDLFRALTKSFDSVS